MLATVNFNNNFRLIAYEIDDVGTELSLTPEAVPAELFVPDVLPEFFLDLGEV